MTEPVWPRVVPDVLVPLGAYLTAAGTPLAELVSDRVFSARLPAGCVMPAVRVHRLDVDEDPPGSGLAVVLLQLDCLDDSDTGAHDVARHVLARLAAARNRVDGDVVWSHRSSSIGPADPEQDGVDDPSQQTPQRTRVAVTARLFVRPL